MSRAAGTSHAIFKHFLGHFTLKSLDVGCESLQASLPEHIIGFGAAVQSPRRATKGLRYVYGLPGAPLSLHSSVLLRFSSRQGRLSMETAQLARASIDAVAKRQLHGSLLHLLCIRGVCSGVLWADLQVEKAKFRVLSSGATA